MRTHRLSLLPGILLLMNACAALPTGPRVLVLPHVGTPLETFQGDDRACQDYASHQLRTAPQAGGSSAATLQWRYDMAYVQCIYAKDHAVPPPPSQTVPPSPPSDPPRSRASPMPRRHGAPALVHPRIVSTEVEPCILQSARSAKLTTASARMVEFGEMGGVTGQRGVMGDDGPCTPHVYDRLIILKCA
jgi:hypothetical protein